MTSLKDLPENVRQLFLYGSGQEEIPFRFDEGGRVYEVTRTFEGVIPLLERRYLSWLLERHGNNASAASNTRSRFNR